MRVAGDAATEAWVLTTEEGQALLAEVAAISTPGPADIERWRRRANAEHVAAALRLAESRVRARAKFERADRMWLDATGLEQATAEPVARHKAGRFEGELVVDLCAGVGGDTVALASVTDVVSVDADHGMCRRARWNASVYEVSTRTSTVQALAERFPLPPRSLVHIDPDRRARTHERAKDVQDYVPGLPFLQALPNRVAGGAIKLGPASDFARHFGSPPFEVELISLGGECKEATIWFGKLATCGRRATVLPSAATWTDRDGPVNAHTPIEPLSNWIYDPDPALGRAGLVDAFATVHELNRIADGVDFLTSRERVASPFLAAFEVLDVVALDMKALRRLVAQHDVGILEIKVRGLDLTPEALRPRLRLQGSQSATLLLSGGAGPARAVLARRESLHRAHRNPFSSEKTGF